MKMFTHLLRKSSDSNQGRVCGFQHERSYEIFINLSYYIGIECVRRPYVAYKEAVSISTLPFLLLRFVQCNEKRCILIVLVFVDSDIEMFYDSWRSSAVNLRLCIIFRTYLKTRANLHEAGLIIVRGFRREGYQR